jgi:membrane associated rhomboid family serine protease
MFPMRDDIPSRTVPLVSYGLLALNVLLFCFELSLGQGIARFVTEWGIVPARFTLADSREVATLFSSMFLHGGWGHLFSNMLYLWIFGDNVEDRMGHVPFLFFYLVAGGAAAAAHIATNPGSPIPTLGASGAVAGVLGAYLVLFPHARVQTILPTFPLMIAMVPAILFLGIWFVMQIFSGALQLSVAGRGTGGVAFLAHVGGFVAGAVFGLLARAVPERRPPPA